MQFISKCLEELNSRKHTSVALPGLTTGFLMFPKRVAAKNACRAVAQFIDANLDSSLREVRFVLHPEDKETLQVMIYMVLL